MTRDMNGRPLVPGYNADRIDVAAGVKAAARFGYRLPEHQMVAEYALMRHARGEEDGAEKSALSGGIDLTSWRVILAHAMAGAEAGSLAMHLISAHADPVAVCRTRAENADQHAREHAGPGTIRNHDPAWLGYDDDKIESILEEVEADA